MSEPFAEIMFTKTEVAMLLEAVEKVACGAKDARTLASIHEKVSDAHESLVPAKGN